MLKTINYLLDRFFPSSEKLELYLAEARKAATGIDRLPDRPGPAELAFSGENEQPQPDPADSVERDINEGRKLAALRRLDKALGHYNFLKQGCLRRGTFTEYAHEEEARLKYTLRKYARRIRSDALAHDLKNILCLTLVNSPGNKDSTY